MEQRRVRLINDEADFGHDVLDKAHVPSDVSW